MSNNIEKYANKKVLLIGAVGGMAYAAKRAKELGMYTVVTDYYKDSQAKEYADAAYDVSTMDIEALSRIVEKEKIDGIFTGFSDNNLRSACEIASKYKLKFYTDLRTTLFLQNKLNFKKLCNKFGVLTPKQYNVDDISMKKVDFPVIVKPSDAYASKGVSKRENYEDLIVGIEEAKKYSSNGEVVIEDYIDGDELQIHYVIENKRFKITSVLNRIIAEKFSSIGKDCSPCIMYNYDRYNTSILDQEKNLGDALISAGLEDAIGFLQGIVRDGKVYLIEMGNRFSGDVGELYNVYENNINIIDEFLKYSITGKFENSIINNINIRFNDFCSNISLYLKPGKVKNIVNQEYFNNIPDIKFAQRYVSIGDEIKLDNIGSYKAFAYRIQTIVPEVNDVIKILNDCKEHVKVLDMNGINILDIDYTINIIKNKFWRNYEKKI